MMVTMGFRCNAWEWRHGSGCKRTALERGTMCFNGVQWCSKVAAGWMHEYLCHMWCAVVWMGVFGSMVAMEFQCNA